VLGREAFPLQCYVPATDDESRLQKEGISRTKMKRLVFRKKVSRGDRRGSGSGSDCHQSISVRYFTPDFVGAVEGFTGVTVDNYTHKQRFS
jgi:hypothetical protein